MPLIEARQLGSWIAEREALWQMKFLDPGGLASHARERGVNFSADDIERLWLLKLLKADVVVCKARARRKGLLFVGRDENGRYLYADARVAQPRKHGWADSARKLRVNHDGVELRFHPFRYWILAKLQRLLTFDIMPMQPLLLVRGYDRLWRWFARHLKRLELASSFERWNEVVALAVSSEPCVYPAILGRIQFPVGRTVEEQRRLIAEHKSEVLELYKKIPVGEIEKIQQQLCVDAYSLDSNRNVYAMLRLAKGKSRLELKDDLGGALYLRTMAEILRRMTEEAQGVQLPEEDHAGIGHTFLEVRERIYGARRLFDNNPAVRREFMRQFQLDCGSRVRWYVEGHTEYGALRSVFGETEGSPVTIVNLRGNVVRGDVLAFRDALRDDIKSGVFSIVSLDADRGDYVRAVRKAAHDDEICGHVYIHSPDFELGNLDVAELEEVVLGVAEARVSGPDERLRLHKAVEHAKSGREFMKGTVAAMPQLAQLGKGIRWGQLLMEYALDHPKRANGGTRPIVDAVRTAARGTDANYTATRKGYRVDPRTGRLVKR